MGILKAVQLTTPLKNGLTAVAFVTDWVSIFCEMGAVSLEREICGI